MAKTKTCPECKALFDPRGLAQHRTTAHGVAPAKPAASDDDERDANDDANEQAARELDDDDAESSPPPAPRRAPRRTTFWNCLDPDW